MWLDIWVLLPHISAQINVFDVLSSLGGSRVPELSSLLAINTSLTLPNHPCSFMYELGLLIHAVKHICDTL
jgi:hypothetical protein